MREYLPDHLAVLPDAEGACSLNDGCGVYNEFKEGGFAKRKICLSKRYCKCDKDWCRCRWRSAKNRIFNLVKENSMKPLVQDIIKNCECLKGKDDLLSQLTNEQLTELKNNLLLAEVAKKTAGVLNPLHQRINNSKLSVEKLPSFAQVIIRNTLDEEEEMEEEEAPAEEATETEEEEAAAEEEEETEKKKKPKEEKPTTNRTAIRNGPSSFGEYIQRYGTPQEQEAWRNAIKINQETRNSLINKLLRNSKEEARPKALKMFSKMSIDDLRALAEMQDTERPHYNRYFGDIQPADLVPDTDDVLPVQNIDYKELSFKK